jgi:hypothetical protein
VTDLPKAADELYDLPLGEFTKARTALEKKLRGDGMRDEAAEVKALRKPTAPAWALNQVARGRANDVKKLLDASRAVGAAQDDLLGGGSRDELRKAVARQRELVGSLTAAAVEAATAADIATTAAFEEKVGATLRAVATDEEAAEELRAGRLVKEREAVGLFGLDAGGDAPKPAARTRKPESTKQRRDLEKRMEAATAQAARARRTAEAAGRALAKERDRAERAAVALREAEADAERAEADASEAESEASRLEGELDALG